MSEKIKGLMMKDWFFIPLMALLGAGVFTSNFLFFKFGAGCLQGVMFIGMMQTKDWISLSSMGVGIVIARILEGPMVGLLDIGGGMMITIGLFAMGLVAQLGAEWVLYNFIASLVVGALLGALEGILIILVRKLIPDGITASGSDIMLNVGYEMSRYMGPLFIICALGVSIPVGIFAAIGGAVAYAREKNILGGIIIGIFIACFIWA
ncbi:MAG: DUF4310 family protein [Erysipelotrichaceae bacterium]|nr:DUF4310 family protein [Erysipelotrichaceae bacterium]